MAAEGPAEPFTAAEQAEALLALTAQLDELVLAGQLDPGFAVTELYCDPETGDLKATIKAKLTLWDDGEDSPETGAAEPQLLILSWLRPDHG